LVHDDAGGFAAAERGGEADLQQRAVAGPQVVADRREDFALQGDLGGELGPRPVTGPAGGPGRARQGLGDDGGGEGRPAR
jgi:hypothetical protein